MSTSLVLIIPKYFDFMAYCLIDGLSTIGVDLAFSESSNGGQKTPLPELERLIANGSTVVVFGSTFLSIPTELRALIFKKLVLVDGGDSSGSEFLRGVTQLLRLPDFYFKRELLLRENSSGVYPIQFGATQRDMMRFSGVQEKKYFLSFCSNRQTNPLRGTAEALLKSLNDYRFYANNTGECAYSVSTPRDLPSDTPLYDEVVRRSLSSLSIPGAGYDCQRYWEIPAAKSALVSWEHDLVIPNDLIDGLECIKFHSMRDLEPIALDIKRNPLRYLDIANAGYYKIIGCHQSVHRAAYFMNVIG